MGKKHWKTIYKELLQPIELYSDDGNSMAISCSYEKKEAFNKIHNELMSGYGETFGLEHEDQLRVGFLRRPNSEDGYEEMDANYYVDALDKWYMPKGDGYVWIYFYGK